MELSDNIIICEANAFPRQLMQPFYLDYVGVVVCHQGMFHFRADGASFVVSAGETVFLSKGVMFQVTDTTQELRYTLLFYRTEQIVDMLGNTVVTMRLYSTIYPSACYVMHTGYEEMLSA